MLETYYYNINEGTCLLKAMRSDTKLSFRLLTHLGTWEDGGDIGWRYTVIHSEPDYEVISEAQAKKLASALGGRIDDPAAAPP